MLIPTGMILDIFYKKLIHRFGNKMKALASKRQVLFFILLVLKFYIKMWIGNFNSVCIKLSLNFFS